jgi:NADPH:quinone reductase
MKAIVYRETGPAASMLRFVERPVPQPGPDEILVKIALSGINPIDYKIRRGRRPGGRAAFPEVVPHSDGAGTVDTVGSNVTAFRVGQRVWLFEAAHGSPQGTAAEYTTVPAWKAVPLPDQVSFEVGASIGIPAMTAHRALTIHEDTPDRLAPGALSGKTVLVAGGAGAVGHAAIQLAHWSGARVIATVSSPEKARLAMAAGSERTVNYRTQDTVAEILRFAPGGVDLVVEVSPAHNAAIDAAVAAPHRTAREHRGVLGRRRSEPHLADRPAHGRQRPVPVPYRLHHREQAKRSALQAIQVATADGALPVGADHGLPLLRYALSDTAKAHQAIENGATGKILIDIT